MHGYSNQKEKAVGRKRKRTGSIATLAAAALLMAGIVPPSANLAFAMDGMVLSGNEELETGIALEGNAKAAGESDDHGEDGSPPANEVIDAEDAPENGTAEKRAETGAGGEDGGAADEEPANEGLTEKGTENEELTDEGAADERPENEDSSNKDVIDNAAKEVDVPIYSQEIVDVVVPAKYAVALNPLGLPVDTGAGGTSTDQVVSKNYGILNKSVTDMIVTVTITVKDRNGGKITFVDSAEAAEEAASGDYALYLAAIPAAEGSTKAGGKSIGEDTTSEALSDVSMEKAAGQAVALHEGANQIAFKLSRASYRAEGGGGIPLGSASANQDGGQLALEGLAPDGSGATAFTFGGAVNPNADWEKLGEGLSLSVSYTYEKASGDEETILGTGAMVAPR